ncbi:aryl-sulfate sulfotransferase [Winogradskyella psychrotolerans]|uniref:aryl-sulfate sulfotransferase n=1 Tax=Winogradskyella psychrotolerans TaxID=1344585 RepID=UPI001C067942|nr:aryl-sulfate sulfotransferase [Winogradskyella psychrotolerans]MBU2928733.1 aryl-sulfate sulfotransferase [Winogradskyella psychrotolerans]
MVRNLLYLLLITINLTYSQNTIGTTHISDGVYEGFTLFTSHTETYLINNCGEVINQWSSNFPPGNAVYLLENGSILRAGRTASVDITFGGQGGVIEIFDWDGNLTWQYYYDTPTKRQHHDVFPMPNGNVLILAATKMSTSEAIQLGRDPMLISENELYNEQIVEVTPVGNNQATIVWEWNVKDHLVQDFDASKDNYGDVSLSPEKLNINFLNNRDGDANWLHFNSIFYNPVLDQIVISSRNLSEIYIIDHSTTTEESASDTGGIYNKGGDFLYRWGNPQSYDQGTESDRKLYGQHSPYVIEPGLVDENKIMLFNNGRDRTPMFSEVFIINPETDGSGVYSYQAGTAYSPISPHYIYKYPIEPSRFFSGILSSAQRLPNGNTLICEGINGLFFEINPYEGIVWKYSSPVNSSNGVIATQGSSPSSYPNVSFRALKYDVDYPAFSGRDITPRDPIEFDPNLTLCKNLSVANYETASITVYPNPTKGKITLVSNTTINKVEVYNLIGEKVYTTILGTFDLSQHVDGIFFLRLYTDAGIISKKLIKN